MRNILTLLSLVIGLSAFGQSAFNMTLEGSLSYQNECNDIWGWTDPNSGIEYALVGTTAGVSIVDVSDATNPTKKQFVQGPYGIWRDLKTWGNYAFVTHDMTFGWNTAPDQGLLIINLDSILGTPTYKAWNAVIPLANGSSDTLKTAHNLWIDEQGKCYVFGANVSQGGALIFDLATDPWNPTYLGMYDQYYLHDGMVRGDTLWGSAVYAGKFVVVDVDKPDSTYLLGSKGTPGSVTHNTWVSDDNTVLFATDEIGAAYLTAYDVTDMANLTELDRIQTSLGTGVIPHNAHVYGQWVVTSYYTAGVQIVDAKFPEVLVEVGYYDTSPYANGGFYGNWGAYPYFESELVVCSDIEQGLFCLEPTYVEASRVHVEVYDSLTGAPLSNASVVFQDAGLNGVTNIDGWSDHGTPLHSMDTIVVSKPGYAAVSTTYQWLEGEFDTLRVGLIDTTVFGVEEDDAIGQWRISPNPSHGHFAIDEAVDGTYELFDIRGRTLEQNTFSAGQWNLRRAYPSGTYILRVEAQGRWMQEMVRIEP